MKITIILIFKERLNKAFLQLSKKFNKIFNLLKNKELLAILELKQLQILEANKMAKLSVKNL